MKKIGTVELPSIKLIDKDGRNWTAVRRREPLVSKQVLMAHLESCGYDVHLFNLKDGEEEYEVGRVVWRDKELTKILVGRKFDIDRPVSRRATVLASS